jgi:hypothetical protein
MSTPADEKLLAEAEKLRAETRELGRHPFARPGTWIPLLLAISAGAGGLLTGYYQWQVKRVEVAEATSAAEAALLEAEKKTLAADRAAFELQQAKEELIETNLNLSAEIEQKRQAVEQARQELAGLQGTIESAQAQLAAGADTAAGAAAQTELASAAQAIQSISANLQRQSGTVFLQFKGSVARDKMRALQRELQGLGYNAPGAERVDSDYTTEVRYFHDADAELAEQVANDIEAFLKDACNLVVDIATKRLTLRAPPSQVEVWLSLNC